MSTIKARKRQTAKGREAKGLLTYNSVAALPKSTSSSPPFCAPFGVYTMYCTRTCTISYGGRDI